MKNSNHQQILMDLYYDQQHIDRDDDCTLGQAANKLSITTAGVEWLIHKGMLDAVAEGSKLLVVRNSLNDYMEIERCQYGSNRYRRTMNKRIQDNLRHISNNQTS